MGIIKNAVNANVKIEIFLGGLNISLGLKLNETNKVFDMIMWIDCNVIVQNIYNKRTMTRILLKISNLLIYLFGHIINRIVTAKMAAISVINLFSEQWFVSMHSTNPLYWVLLVSVPTQQCQQSQLYYSSGVAVKLHLLSRRQVFLMLRAFLQVIFLSQSFSSIKLRQLNLFIQPYISWKLMA